MRAIRVSRSGWIVLIAEMVADSFHVCDAVVGYFFSVIPRIQWTGITRMYAASFTETK